MFKFWSYSEEHKQYTGARETFPILPPGLYQIGVSMRGEPVASTLIQRQDQLAVLGEDTSAAKVLKEIEIFWGAKDKYKEFGMSHKRGILLHGLPGCGKTGIVQLAISAVTSKDGLAFQMDDPEQFRDAISMVRQIENGRPIIAIIEDIESVCRGYEEDLLEVMDGASAMGDGILFLATTNNLEKVPDRIRNRPSRIDTLIEVGLPSRNERLEYLKFITPEGVKIPSADLADKTEGLSLAHIKELILSLFVYKRPFEETLARLTPPKE